MGEEVLGTAAKVEISKENTTIVGDGSSEEAVQVLPQSYHSGSELLHEHRWFWT